MSPENLILTHVALRGSHSRHTLLCSAHFAIKQAKQWSQQRLALQKQSLSKKEKEEESQSNISRGHQRRIQGKLTAYVTMTFFIKYIGYGQGIEISISVHHSPIASIANYKILLLAQSIWLQLPQVVLTATALILFSQQYLRPL